MVQLFRKVLRTKSKLLPETVSLVTCWSSVTVWIYACLLHALCLSKLQAVVISRPEQYITVSVTRVAGSTRS